MKILLIIALLILTAIIAPLNRVLSHTDYAPTDESVTSNDIPGLINLGAIPAANTGPYMIQGYRHPTCAGSIAILTLYRNAEGSHILSRKFNVEELRYGYVMAGKIYHSFPQFGFAWQKVSTAAARLSNAEKSSAPATIAFAEQGQCQLAETIAKHSM